MHFFPLYFLIPPPRVQPRGFVLLLFPLVLRWNFWNDAPLSFPLFEHPKLYVSLPSSNKISFFAWYPELDWISIIPDQMWSLIACPFLGTLHFGLFSLDCFDSSPASESPLMHVVMISRGMCLSYSWPQILALCIFSVYNLCTIHTALFQSKIGQKFQFILKSYFSLWESKLEYHILASSLTQTTGVLSY